MLFEFLYTVGYCDDGAVAVDEEQGAVGGAVLLEHTELVVEINEAGPRVAVALDCLAHGIGGLELMGEAEHVQSSVMVLVV